LSAPIPTPENLHVEVYGILLRRESRKKDVGDESMKPKMIGTVGTPRKSSVGAEIGYNLHPDYWGKGYMKEALALFIALYWDTASRSFFISFIPVNKSLGQNLDAIMRRVRAVRTTLTLTSGEDSRDTLIAQINPKNFASKRVVENLGFKLVGKPHQRASESQDEEK
jgi:RimJ/RimL family protein N-acetyltransferase